MKRIILTSIGLLIAAAVLGLGYAYWQNTNEADKQNAESKRKITASEVADNTKSSPALKPGVYAPYDESLVASSDGPVLLFFHAPWCPQCRAIDEDIVQDGTPDGVTILKVDYDSSHELRKRYGVTLQTTFIKVDRSGNQISKYVAYNEPTFDSVMANLLD